jgi:hypothetical protein
MNKIIPIFVIGIFVLSSISAIATIDYKKPVSPISDELDQYQDVMTESAAVPIGNIPIPQNPMSVQVAQSFIPTKDIITRTELFIGKNSTATYPLTVSIRQELTEEDLTVIDIDPAVVPTEDYDWVEIDFEDIQLSIGETYYIVCLTENITDNYYAWGANNISESYPYGCAWFSLDEGGNWTNESTESNIQNSESFSNTITTSGFLGNITWDMCFRTYGRDNNPPDIPTIEGPTTGRAGETLSYIISTIDPDDDQVYYWISWFDDCPGIYWDGPYNSEEAVTKSYTYDEEGTYTIRVKAKDIFDAESDWATLQVTIPRSRVSNINILFRLFQLFPNSFLLLKQILGL